MTSEKKAAPLYMLTTIATFCWASWGLDFQRGAKSVFVQVGPAALSFKLESSHV
jgi:hypothetical protein